MLTAFFMVVALALLAFSVDMGYLMTLRSELKRSTDAAALAGAGTLVDGGQVAEHCALEYFARNAIGNRDVTGEEDWQDDLPNLLAAQDLELAVQMGHWDPAAKVFSQCDVLPSAMRVSAAYRDAPLFFGNFMRAQHSVYEDGQWRTEWVPIDLAAESIARYQPRDIVLVLDFSASMNDDSELRRIYEYGEAQRAIVEANLLQIYQELGSPVYGNMQFEPQYISSTDTNYIKAQLGLTYVPYPYPGGSWNEYIDYVKSYYSTYLQRAGYQKKYGYLTLVNYWLERRPVNHDTPSLWAVSAQPVTAVKDATGVFMQYIGEVDTDDRVALVVYNSPTQTAKVEHSLTDNFQMIGDTVDQRQAGHYDQYTNIGAGIEYARNELLSNGRPGAFKMIVLMTDGQANRPSGYAEDYVRQRTQLVADEHWPIVTISLGNAADTSLMQEVADTTGGVHFNVPGGEAVTNYEAQLLTVFRQIADHRPLVLVK
ncbi:MAG: VWA domain-containing protein [Pirellulales bacterium]|nr:VWA domain-containing protein [Pirellulales bacterium]